MKIVVTEPAIIVLVADGLTPKALDDAIASGDVPELSAMRAANGRHVVTTVFPSVTGVAYVPLLTGRHPAQAGVPGLRWYDRSRRLPAMFGHSRSYVGTQLRRIDDDLSPHATTAFELVPGKALGSGAMITRGLSRSAQLDRGARHALRVIRAHVTGDVAAWAALEEELAEQLVARVRRERPRFTFAAFTAGDKAAHAGDAAGVRQSLRLVDQVVGEIRRDAERDGRWDSVHLWVVSDHGHSPVHSHFDLADALRHAGMRVRAHPWTIPDQSEAAVMVSGNSMAHVYLDLEVRTRRDWSELAPRWLPRIGNLWSHPAIDLIAVRRAPGTVDVYRGNAWAEIIEGASGLTYRPIDGNPLGIEPFEDACDEEAHDRTDGSDYPDGVVQLARLVLADRSGDVVVSATPGWDLRRRYEPIEHVSSHGALHSSHMMVPLVCNRRPTATLRRIADVHRALTQSLGFGKRHDRVLTSAKP